MSIEGTSVKKRLMFVTSNDYYFLTYNILFLLKELGCDNEDKVFIDHRKLAFLIGFVADERLAMILEKAIRTNTITNETDRELLSTAWSVGLVRGKQINRLLGALESKGILGIKKDEKRVTTSVWYKKTSLLSHFLDKNEFHKERQNAKLLRITIKGLSGLTFDTLQKKIFKNFGVNKYGVSSY